MKFTDRYQALGIPYPDPETICPGSCEGTGVYPQHKDDEGTPEECAEWDRLEKEEPADDGWHLINCPTCGGTGKDRKKMEDNNG